MGNTWFILFNDNHDYFLLSNCMIKKTIAIDKQNASRRHCIYNIENTDLEIGVSAFTTFTIIFLSHTYTSIALNTRLLAQAYRPSQIELSSPGIH